MNHCPFAGLHLISEVISHFPQVISDSTIHGRFYIGGLILMHLGFYIGGLILMYQSVTSNLLLALCFIVGGYFNAVFEFCQPTAEDSPAEDRI